MTASHCVWLSDRGVVAVTGPDASTFLQSLITNDMGALDSQTALHTGLLSPQGKILFDFFVVKAADGFRLDVAREHAAALVKRLSMYKLRAAVAISNISDTTHVLAVWGGEPYCFDSQPTTYAFQDPRLAAMGLRILADSAFAVDVAKATNGMPATEGDYHAHRIGLGVSEGGKDYAFGDAFPHEALFDQLHGVSFSKGCYVGQEIVSRMEHRGTARKRIVHVSGSGPLPATGTDIMAGGITIGTLGSVAGEKGLALLRLDRVSEFAAKGVAITAAEQVLSVTIPTWAAFQMPTPAADAGPA